MTADGIIRLLADDVIDRIAAGEVIERPASVVKELLENAVDAGASCLDVHLEAGGLARITISDDGCGMTRADAERSILRHATSKLTTAEDLFAIRTLGFRGEALSSIAAVSRLTITTRRPADAVGTRVSIEGGSIEEVTEVGCPVGTTVDVRDLFFNTPARRKFMRSPATEQAHACEAALRVVLPRRCGLLLAAAARRLLDLPEDAAPEERFALALGGRIGKLYPFGEETGGVVVRGCIAHPERHRADAKGLWFFVNGRHVRDRMLQRAVLEGYRSMLERGRYPVALVGIDMAPAAVDVNVHPQKLEVRFADGNAVFRVVAHAIATALARSPWLESDLGATRGGRREGELDPFLEAAAAAVVREAPDGFGYRARAPFAGAAVTSAAFPGTAVPPAAFLSTAVSSAPLPSEQRELGFASVSPARAAAGMEGLPAAGAAGRFGGLEPVGQLFGTYIVCEGAAELVIIDQHAAHERITFERLRRELAGGAIVRQQLLFPEPIELSPHRAAILEERTGDLARFGFEVEPVGPGRFAVRAVPAALDASAAAAAAVELLQELESLEEAALGASATDASARLLSRCACHASVRAGDALSRDEMRALLSALDAVDFGASCPHGRPVYWVMTRGELERRFHR